MPTGRTIQLAVSLDLAKTTMIIERAGARREMTVDVDALHNRLDVVEVGQYQNRSKLVISRPEVPDADATLAVVFPTDELLIDAVDDARRALFGATRNAKVVDKGSVKTFASDSAGALSHGTVVPVERGGRTLVPVDEI